MSKMFTAGHPAQPIRTGINRSRPTVPLTWRPCDPPPGSDWPHAGRALFLLGLVCRSRLCGTGDRTGQEAQAAFSKPRSIMPRGRPTQARPMPSPRPGVRLSGLQRPYLLPRTGATDGLTCIGNNGVELLNAKLDDTATRWPIELRQRTATDLGWTGSRHRATKGGSLESSPWQPAMAPVERPWPQGPRRAPGGNVPGCAPQTRVFGRFGTDRTTRKLDKQLSAVYEKPPDKTAAS